MDIRTCGKHGLCHSPEGPCWVTNTSRTGQAQVVSIMWQKCSSTDSRLELFQNVLEVLSGTPIKRT